MRLENVQIGPKITKIEPKNVENQANWPKNIQKCVTYCKIPTQDKNRGTSS